MAVMVADTDFQLDDRIATSTFLIARHDGIQVRLADDSRYFWLILVPEATEARELHDLGDRTAQALTRLATRLGAWLKSETGADKINSAAIGNVVPQLHFHIVARHRGDAAWPDPIWGNGAPVPMEEDMRLARIKAVNGFVSSLPSPGEPIYKICDAALWDAAVKSGLFTGAEIDLQDGYIHFSTAKQAAETARRHFSGRQGLVFVAIDTAGLDVVWEPSRGGDLFPHLYSSLPVSAALSVVAMHLDGDGTPKPEGGFPAPISNG